MASSSFSNTSEAAPNATFSFREPPTRRSSSLSSESDHTLRAAKRLKSAPKPSFATILTTQSATSYDRKTYRKEAERHRRERIKFCFEGVKQILQRDSFGTRSPSKVKVLDTAREYIEDLRNSAQGKERTASEMEQEIEWSRVRLGVEAGVV
ncbi:hypothetical protein HDU98_007622 [Podochytrium sp. JEL0797]|nr:hypothetical protein HDU98_007622 [Podochytrium sp. JEL0797]